jgi:mRNA m6A methyltransferase catalytic subunit
VTGRAAEVARDCLKNWGYRRIEEIAWVKTNQLQRVIRTGRTGHWINHTKEHCIVGIKGNPRNLNSNLDTDVLVSEVRETSRKPDEIYNMIERMFPGSLKLEIFGRPHNTHTNWVTLGNQLSGVRKLLNIDLLK